MLFDMVTGNPEPVYYVALTKDMANLNTLFSTATPFVDYCLQAHTCS